MLPSERGQVGQERIRDRLAAAAHRVERAAEINCIPKRNGGRDQNQAAGAVLLRFGGAVAQVSEPMEANGAGEALDAAAAVSFVRSRILTERVGIYGVFLGGAAAVLGSETQPVDAIVLASVNPDTNAALANRLRAGLGRVAGPRFTPLLTRFSKSFCRLSWASRRASCAGRSH